jgi:hypothetical protein
VATRAWVQDPETEHTPAGRGDAHGWRLHAGRCRLRVDGGYRARFDPLRIDDDSNKLVWTEGDGMRVVGGGWVVLDD